MKTNLSENRNCASKWKHFLWRKNSLNRKNSSSQKESLAEKNSSSRKIALIRKNFTQIKNFAEVRIKKSFVFLVAILMCAPLFLFGCEEEAQLCQYTIEALYNEQLQTLSCTQNVKYINTSGENLGCVCFYVYANAFSEVAVSTAYIAKAYRNGESFGGLDISRVMVDAHEAEWSISGSILTVQLADGLADGDSAQIEMEYVVRLANVWHRLGYGDNTVNFGNFFPIACVFEGGEFVKNGYADNGDPFYSEVADFSVKITYPSEFVLACTGRAEISEVQVEAAASAEDKAEEEGTAEEVDVEETRGSSAEAQENLEEADESSEEVQEDLEESRESSVMNVAVCTAENVRDFCFVLSKNFQVASTKTDGGVEVSYYYIDDESAQAHLETAVRSVETFSSLFGEYPYSTLAVVQADFCFGGMEYPNLVMIAADASGEDADYVIVHEIAHQWWYGAVGNNQFSCAWMDEGLTEFSTALFFQQNADYGLSYTTIMDNARGVYQNFVQIYSSILGSVDESMNRSLDQFATEPEYVNIAYTKGMLLFDALRSSMSESKFFKCLREYFEEFCFCNSNPELLIESFSRTSGRNLQGFFNSWIDGVVKIGV